MTAHDVLMEDHRRLRSMLDRLVHTAPEDSDERRHLLHQFQEEVSVHAQIEDDLYYPRIREVSPLFAVAHAEHRQLDDQVAVILRTDPAGADFLIEAQMLAAILGHHADEEEQQMFVQAEELGAAELDALGRELHALRERLRHSILTKVRFRIKRAVLQRL